MFGNAGYGHPSCPPLTLTSTLARVILSRVELPKRESVAPTRAPGAGSRAAEFDRWLRGKKRLAAWGYILARLIAPGTAGLSIGRVRFGWSGQGQRSGIASAGELDQGLDPLIDRGVGIEQFAEPR